MFILVPAYPGCPGSKAVKRSLLLLLLSLNVPVRQKVQVLLWTQSKQLVDSMDATT